MMKKIPVVLYCTENYLSGSLNVIKSLNLYHDDLYFYLYTVNFNYKVDIENVETVYIEEPRIEQNITFDGFRNDMSNTNMFKAIFFRSKVVLHSLEILKLDNVIYIDSDIIPTGNISKIFNYFNDILDYPLIQQSIYEYQIIGEIGNPFHNGGFDETNIAEYPLMNKHHIKMNNRTYYSTTSVMLYNQKCKQFLMEVDWMNEFPYGMDKGKIQKYYPFNEETTVNVLLWKYKYNLRLPLMQMNVDDFTQVKEYYQSNYDSRNEIKPFVIVPSKKERKDVLFFHGVKGKLSDRCFDLQKGLFRTKINQNENKYFISTDIDFNRELTTSFFDGEKMVYQTNYIYQKDLEYWFSPSIKFENIENLIVKIYDDGKLIFKK
jgi:hypothetical protein